MEHINFSLLSVIGAHVHLETEEGNFQEKTLLEDKKKQGLFSGLRKKIKKTKEEKA